MARSSKGKKAQIIDGLEAALAKSNLGVLTDYRGFSTLELTALRRKLQESGVDYQVVKNTLARSAAKKAGKTELVSLFEGPVAIALGSGDYAKPVKVLADFGRETKADTFIKGGFLGDRLLTSHEVMTLATLPSREVLLARVIGQMQSPVANLLAHLASPIQGFIGVLNGRIKQMEGN
ncbi:MAG: 50S ribosomal protein L10 [Chloroflexota bacterium]